jgi:cell division protease FtsH
MYSKENRTNVTFDDVAGAQEAKDEVSELVEFLKNPGRFQRIGGRIPRGVLLVGPPGCGKTLLAKAIAGEAEVPFFSISGSDFVEMFVGVGASRVRDLFKQARENSPCIIFLDEIDAVGRRRGSGMGGGHDEREQTLNAILVEMDGFSTDEGIIVVAATNRPDVLDPALLRPGRFDREVTIDLPDLEGRRAILDVHLKRVKHDQSVVLEDLARSTPGYSGADLAAIVNEAAIMAVLDKRDEVAMPDLEEARDKVRYGRKKRSAKVEEEDRLVTAYHEAGHAIVAQMLEHGDPPHKVTIVPRGRALGLTMMLPDRDTPHTQRRRLQAQLAIAFGGRVAEQEFCGDISAGAVDDIRRATDLARAMVTELGMSDLIGPINYGDRAGSEFLGTELSRGKDHSESTAQEIDREVRRMIDEAYALAERVIRENREGMERVTRALVRFETLNGEEIRKLLRGVALDDLRPEPPPEPESTPERRPEPPPRRSADGDLPGDLPGTTGLSPA